MYKSNNFLNKTFYKFLFPTILSVLGCSVSVMIEGVIVGNTLGDIGLSALSLCSPLFLLMCTLGSLSASGAATLSSISLGKNKEEKSNEYYTISFIMLAILSILFTIIASIFIEDVVILLGATSKTYQYVRDYAGVLTIGASGKFLLYLPLFYLRLDGKTNLVSVLFLATAIIDGILDWVFLAVLEYGMVGAAWGTVISSYITVIVGFILLKYSSFKFCFTTLHKFFRKVIAISQYGSTVAMNNLATALRIICLNSILLSAGGNDFLSIFTIVHSLTVLSLSLVTGVPQTASPIIGVYHGEKDSYCIRVLIKNQLSVGIPLAVIFSIIILVFSNQIGELFGLEGNFDTLHRALVFFAISVPLSMLNNIFAYLYSTTGKILLANIITICRVFLFAVMIAFAFSHNITMMWIFYVLAELLTMFVILVILYIIKLKNKNLSLILLLDDKLETQGKAIDFSVENSTENIVSTSKGIEMFCENNNFTPKQTMVISLAIEEILVVVMDKCFLKDRHETVDLRLFLLDEVIGLRFRYGGLSFNPLILLDNNDELDAEMMGIKMITKLAKTVKYTRTFGTNTFFITL